MYTFGNAGTGSTYRHNLEALEQWRIVPRMLRNATHRNLEVSIAFPILSFPAIEPTEPLQTTLFGLKLPSPILVAPLGVQGILHKDGELATASAAANVGVPFIMSTASTRSIEAVAKANSDGHRWYQLYWYVSHPKDPSFAPLLHASERAGRDPTR
jgi:isopentenyl diphosphate isomerase/L-lactate dehydrogenase-like FMN-dependent dehydrogenase